MPRPPDARSPRRSAGYADVPIDPHLFETVLVIDDPEEVSARSEKLLAAIDRLPAKQRDAVNAVFWERLSHAEAAKRVGMAGDRSGFAILLRKALTTLKRKLS